MKKKIIAKNAPKATGPYSHAIQIGKMLFTSGQIHLTPDGKLLKGKIEDETRQILENLKSILEEAGYSFKDVVKTTIFGEFMPTINQLVRKNRTKAAKRNVLLIFIGRNSR